MNKLKMLLGIIGILILFGSFWPLDAYLIKSYYNKSSLVIPNLLVCCEVLIVAFIGFIAIYLLKEFKVISKGLIRYTKYVYILLSVLLLMFYFLGGGGHGPFLLFIGVVFALFVIMTFPTILFLLFVPSKTGTIFAFAALVPFLNIFFLNPVVNAIKKYVKKIK